MSWTVNGRFTVKDACPECWDLHDEMVSAGVRVGISMSEADVGGLMDVLYWRRMRL